MSGLYALNRASARQNVDAPESLRFAGYAALFDRVDRGGDIIRQGAFRHSLSRQKSWPLLWQHRPDQIIGEIIYAAEDRRGLRVIGRLMRYKGPINPIANKARHMLASGGVTGLSFGYRVRSYGEGLFATNMAAGDTARRELLALDLVEVSLVTHPMQPGAYVHMLESA